MKQTAEKTVAMIHALPRFGGAPGLERIRRLCAALGSPEEKLAGRFLHIAGTNGKGSVAAFTDAALRAGGYYVGRFTSPYISDFRERIEIDGEPITEERLIDCAARVFKAAETLGEPICQFEAVTAIGLLAFAKARCDLVVWETGLGGRLDPTNVVTPLLSVITHIALDHTEILGDTVEKIAGEKAGIIKPGRPVIVSPLQEPAALAVLREEAKTSGAPFYLSPTPEDVRAEKNGLSFRIGAARYHSSLCGSYQSANASAAYTALTCLPSLGFPLSEEAIAAGIAHAHIPARFETLSHAPRVILDGAHNEDGIAALCSSVRLHTAADEPRTAILGMLRDKSPDMTLRVVWESGLFEKVFCVTPSSPRAMPAEELAALLSSHGMHAEACRTVSEAVGKVRDAGMTAVAFGSLYSAGEIRACFLPWWEKPKQ